MTEYIKNLKTSTRFEIQEWLSDMSHFSKTRKQTTMEHRCSKILRQILKEINLK